MPKHNQYETVTAAIVSALEAGTRPWASRWQGGPLPAPRRVTGDAYRGINTLMLWLMGAEHGYAGSTWLTYKQAQAVGAQVRVGEQSTRVVYYSTITRGEGDAEEKIPFLKTYCVFNTDQMDHVPAKYLPAPAAPREEFTVRGEFTDWLTATGAAIAHGGNQAFYQRSTDSVQVPAVADFVNEEAYAATVAHELVHWTGAKHRLDREFGKKYGDQAYAFEELVAEIGAAFVCASLGISATPRDDHASYLDAWLKVLKQDSRAIFRAASAAQKAADYLLPATTSAEIAEAA